MRFNLLWRYSRFYPWTACQTPRPHQANPKGRSDPICRKLQRYSAKPALKPDPNPRTLKPGHEGKMAKLHLIKLCVGVDSLEQLITWRAARPTASDHTNTRHVTRMWPKREAELLEGGSLFWIIKGEIQARQKIVGFEEVIGNDGIRRCAILMDPNLVRTTLSPRRPFQGWRYLNVEDAPPDMPAQRKGDDALPNDLSRALADIGVL